MDILKHYKWPELEELAENFLSAKGRFDNRSFRIEAVLESGEIGYKFFCTKGLSQLAEAYVPLTGKIIHIDEDQYDSAVSFRLRFTLAEELAHILIHIPQFDGKTAREKENIRDAITDLEYAKIESEAKYLASALLMPKKLFEERFIHFSEIQSGVQSNQIRKLRYIFNQLSMDFNISCHSAAIRAKQLNLIDQPQLTDLLEFF